MQDPPLWLSIDSLSAPNIQPEDGEIWKIVGGKVLIFFSGSYFGSFAIVWVSLLLLTFILIFLLEAKKSVLVVKEIRLSLDVLLCFCIFFKKIWSHHWFSTMCYYLAGILP